MARGAIKGITVEIDGNTTKLQQALKGVNSTLTTTQSGLKDVNKLLKMDPGNAELLTQKQQYLSSAIEATKQKLQTERTALEQLKTADGGEKSAEQQRALQREIIETEQSLRRLETQAREAASVLGSQMQAAGEKIQAAGQKIAGVGQTLSTHLTLPLVAAGAAAVSVTADFDKSMSSVRALTGATAEEFDLLRQKARDLGAATKFSASEAADAMTELALAGWSTEQMLSGIDGVLNLAAASGLELADAAGIISGNLAAFDKAAEDSANLADMLATAQANSKTTAAQMGEAWNNSATSMTRAGQAAETTTAILMGMASVNDTGSAAGTKLNAVMSQMTQKMEDGAIAIGKTTVQVMDQEGNFRDLIDIISDIEKATEGMGDAERAAALQTTFNRTSMQGLNELLAVGSDKLREYRGDLEDCSGAAKEMAEVMEDNLTGQVTKLKSAAQELGIGLGDLLVPKAQQLVSVAGHAVDTLNGLDEGTKNLIVNAGLLAAAAGPVLTVGGKLTEGIGKLTAGAGDLVTLMASGSALGVVGAFGAAAAAAGIFVGSVFAVTEAINQNNAANEAAADTLTGVQHRIRDATDAYNEAVGEISGKEINVSGLVSQLAELTGASEQDAAAQEKIRAIVAELNEAVPGLSLEYDDLTGSLNMTTDAVLALAQAEINKQKIEEKQKLLVAILEEQSTAEAELADRKRDEAEAQELLNQAQERYGHLVQEKASVGELSDAMDDINNYSRDLEIATDLVENAQIEVDRLAGEADGLAGEISELSGATEEYSGAAVEAADATSGMTEEEIAAAEAAEELEKEYQELVDTLNGLPDLVSATGMSVDNLAWILQTAGISAGQFAADVATAKDGVINGFKEIGAQSELTAEEMTAVLQKNLETYRSWGSNLETLWAMAKSNQDTAVMEYINHLAEMGPEYASAVAEFANGGYAELEAQAQAYQEAGQLAAQYTAEGLYMDAYLAENAASDMAESAAEEAGEVSGWTEAGQGYMEELAGGIDGAAGQVSDAAKSAGEGGVTAAGGVTGWNSVGSNYAQGIADGITSNTGAIRSAAIGAAKAALAAAKASLAIKSPSRVARDQIGLMYSEGVAEGILKGVPEIASASNDAARACLTPAPESGMESWGSSLLQSSGSAAAGNAEVLSLLKTWLPQLANMQMVLDSGQTVGALAPGMDRALGTRQTSSKRGLA